MNNLTLMMILLTSFTITACKERVYLISGTIQNQPVNCLQYPELKLIPSETEAALQLFSEAIQSNDIDRIKEISEQIKTLTQQIKNHLRPEVSNEQFLIKYIWNFNRRYLKTGETLTPIIIGFSGTPLSLENLKFKDKEENIEMSFERKASILEVCLLAKSLQALLLVSSTDGNPRFYYRATINLNQNLN